MATSIRLRPWQHRALQAFTASGRADFLAVATPGAGKTTFALTAAAQALLDGRARGLIVVAPTQHLKHQWSEAAAQFGVSIDPAWTPRDGALPADLHGIVTTYAQVATSARELRALSAGAFVVLDEIHHAGDDRAWGTGILEAFGVAALRLSVSGTPFRSDTAPIPFVDYHLDEARPDFEYGYAEALADRSVVRPVFFPRVGGQMEWVDHGGDAVLATFEDALDTQRANQRLRTALSLEGEWLPAVMDEAHARLSEIRRSHPGAGGLVIAMDRAHAQGIASLLADRYSVRATVATSDDPMASARIARFATSTEPWIVAVRMVSEGVDIPRLRVGVFATNTTTELFFRQAVGRFARWIPGLRTQKSHLFIPDDPRLRRWAEGIAEQRRHSLRSRPDEGDVFDLPPEEQASVDDVGGAEEQMSLFAVISAVADRGEVSVAGPLETERWDEPDRAADDHYEIHLDVPPLPNGAVAGPSATVTATGGAEVLTRSQLRRRLRDGNADAVREIVRSTGLDHRQVNAELNRLSGIAKVTEATTQQLQRRLAAADGWLRRV